MSSPCNVPRIIRCRVKDLASCFYACRLPLEEETSNFCRKPTKVSNGGLVFASSKVADGGAHKARKKMSKKKDRKEKSVRNLSCDIHNIVEDGKKKVVDEPDFADEDYIVFCFGEDGKIDMINEGNHKSLEGYDDNIDRDDDEHVNVATNAASSPVINREKGDEKGSKENGPSHDDEMTETSPIEQQNSSKMDSFESCDSNLSDTSTSSFAFPVLGIEWIGSPVHMPKSEKAEAQSFHLHCCRF